MATPDAPAPMPEHASPQCGRFKNAQGVVRLPIEATATRSRPPAAHGSDRPVSGLARGRTFLPNVPPSQIQRPSGLRYDTALTVAGAAPGWQLLASPVSRFTRQQFDCSRAPIGSLYRFRGRARRILASGPQITQPIEFFDFNQNAVDPGGCASYSARHG